MNWGAAFVVLGAIGLASVFGFWGWVVLAGALAWLLSRG